MGYDWSEQAEEPPTNYALMASTTSNSINSSDSEVHTCSSKDCLETYKTLKEHYDTLNKEYKTSEGYVNGYKIALANLEARIVVIRRMRLFLKMPLLG